MEKKYRLTEETINVDGKTLYHIEALRDFGDVKKGEKGGYVENEDNLSHYDNCWVYENAMVCGNAQVYDNAKIYGNAVVCDKAMVYNNAKVYDNVMVFDNAMVYGNAKVSGNAIIHEDAKVYGNAKVSGNAAVFGDTEIYDNAEVYGDTMVCGNAKVYGNARVCDNVWVNCKVQVCGCAEVFGKAKICGDAVITSNSDYIVFKNWWSSGRYFTWTKSNNMWKVGCFHGTGKELIEKAYKDSEISGREYERVVKYVESIIADDGKDK